MLIGKVSTLTGATRKTIRHYEAIGLLSPPKRKGNYRVYADEDVIVISMICRAKSLGFSLAELKDLVNKKTENNEFPLELATELINTKLTQINIQIKELQNKDKALKQLKTDLVNNYT